MEQKFISRVFALGIAGLIWANASVVNASVPFEVFYDAVAVAARVHAVPYSVLLVVTLTETGRAIDGQSRPWPWAVNMEGEVRRFDNKADALRYVKQHFANGARSLDRGCFQLNCRWHGQHFSSVDEMSDPFPNARYAARFLTQLFDEFGDWPTAVAAYHSRTPTYAQGYRARFLEMYALVEGQTGPAPQDSREPTQLANLYPLLTPTQNVPTLGSLGPLPKRARP